MLPRDLIDLMRDLNVFPVVVATADKEGNVHITFITWVYPIDERKLRIAVSSNAKTSQNIRETGRVAIQIFAPDKALSVYGNAKEIKERIEDVSFPVSVFEVDIDTVDNALFPGATITGIIPFAHTGNVLKMTELDSKVLKALKE